MLLVDTSGSMHGEKAALQIYCLTRLLVGLGDVAFPMEPNVTIITFGGQPTVVSKALLSQTEIPELLAGGETRLTEAVALATSLAAPDSLYILLSDGATSDGGFVSMCSGLKAYAIGIGFDADMESLSRFTGSPDRVFGPEEAEYLPGFAMQVEFEVVLEDGNKT